MQAEEGEGDKAQHQPDGYPHHDDQAKRCGCERDHQGRMGHGQCRQHRDEGKTKGHGEPLGRHAFGQAKPCGGVRHETHG